MVFKLAKTAYSKLLKILFCKVIKDGVKGNTFVYGLPLKKEKNGRK
jgi:hypothetical protein